MSISDIAASSSGGSFSELTGSKQTIAENFTAFLSLLTTQLKNQSPLEPLDTNQFTQQLVQFTEVEQSLKQNKSLESITAQLATMETSNAVSYIGSNVSASGVRTTLESGRAEWRFDAASAGTAEISIIDRSGNTVWTETKDIRGGREAFTWNGQTLDGNTAPDGTYSIQMVGSDREGNRIKVETEVLGRVTEVEFAAEGPMLVVGGTRVPLSSVRTVTGL
ncbi:MAG: flagellar hook assembly protein FlgD [Planctomycetota bacterium]